ncbi:MAG: pilus assembly protein PilY [Myxococcales bacterium]
MTRTALSAALALAGLFASSEALALDEAACCVQSTSKVDAILNPARGSDEKFFGRAGGPPNILFILDNSGSMEGQSTGDYGAWPQVWDDAEGCGWSALNSLGYSKNVTYPPMRKSVTATNPFNTDWFDKTKYYDAPKLGYGNNFNKKPGDTANNNRGTIFNSDTDACNGAPDVANCKSCLANSGYYIFGRSTGTLTNANMEGYYGDTENRQNWMVRDDDKTALVNSPAPTFQVGTGCNNAASPVCSSCTTWTDTAPANIYYDSYNTTRVEFSSTVECARVKSATYQNYSTERRVTGNFLNFYAPRDSGAVITLSNIINDLKEVRFALYTLNRNTSSDKCFWGSDGGCVVKAIGPSCAKSYPWDQSHCDSNRNSILTPLTSTINFNNGTPITGALYAAGYYFNTHTGSGSTPTAGYSTGAGWTSNSDFDDADAVCWSCGFNAIVLLSDGEPNTEKPMPSAITSMSATEKCAEVSEYLWTHDARADMADTQRIATYTIGFSDNAAFSTTLQEVASKGGGSFYPATSTQGLRDAMLLIIEDIARRNTAFSTSNIASVQSGQTAMAAIMPRMMPLSGKPWTGDLYRFELYNEWVMNNDNTTLDSDKNGDGDENDVFIVDKDGSIILEDGEGKFVKKGTSTPAVPHWEARKQLLTNGFASRKIYTIVDTASASGATKDGYFTEHDNASGLIEFDSAHWSQLIDYLGIKGTGMCPFGTLTGEQGAFFEKLHLTLPIATAAVKASTGYDFNTTPKAVSDYNELCARALIQFIRGQDLGDEDGDSDRTEPRNSILGDIFHSSPIVVDPPVDKAFCRAGMHNQCVRTLFDQNLPITPTELVTTNETHCASLGANDYDAYDVYHWNNRKRARQVLVGANDGMLHAFDGGTEDNSGTCQDGVFQASYNAGTGNELWAFIPPDALPRLADIVLSHQFYVDGDIMVRDIWADGSGSVSSPDGKKQSDEFHTIAIVAEGRGGTHYFALELKWDGLLSAAAKPAFRWMYPQPCTPEAALFGKTLFALSPKAPPVGPVLLDSSTLSSLPGIQRHGANAGDPTTTERYVAFLSGGWSPSLEKGRGIYMVDAWNGFVQGRNDNLWWKFERSKDGADTGEVNEPRANLTHSIVAPVAMVDYDSLLEFKMDGFFDTALVGDTRGQLWVTRFSKPGKWNSSDKTISNWGGARSFEQDLQGAPAGTDEDSGGAATAKSVRHDWPFHYVAETAVQLDTAALRAFVGTGDRYSILEDKAGQCRWDSPLPCAKLGCDEYKTIYKMKRLTREYKKIENHWKDLQFEHGKRDEANASLSACGTVANEVVVTAEISESKINSCPGAGANYDPLRNMKVECGRDANNNFFCQRTDTVAPNYYDITADTADDTTYMSGLGKNRFYGLVVLDRTRTFDEGRTTASDATGNSAKGYDAMRLTDRQASPSVNTYGDLVDVTDVYCDTTGTCKFKATNLVTSGAASADKGWFYEYIDGHKFRTATGAAVANGCALWSSLFPVLSGSSACANTVARSRLYQADYISGLPNCAEGMAAGTYACSSSSDCPEGGTCTSGKCSNNARFVEAAALTPPPEPKVVVQISKLGQVKYSAMTPPKGGESQVSSVDIAQAQDILQSVYELPVSRRMHQCRHVDASKCAPVPP